LQTCGNRIAPISGIGKVSNRRGPPLQKTECIGEISDQGPGVTGKIGSSSEKKTKRVLGRIEIKGVNEKRGGILAQHGGKNE